TVRWSSLRVLVVHNREWVIILARRFVNLDTDRRFRLRVNGNLISSSFRASLFFMPASVSVICHHRTFLQFRPNSWCAREDLNLQSFRNQILSLARLPFRHARILYYNYLRVDITSSLTLATVIATVLPHETDCNPKQCWRKVKLTPIQI